MANHFTNFPAEQPHTKLGILIHKTPLEFTTKWNILQIFQLIRDDLHKVTCIFFFWELLKIILIPCITQHLKTKYVNKNS